MKAMVLENILNLTETSSPLKQMEMPRPIPDESELLIKISTCGVCHTELDEIEGRTAPSRLPIILGHEVVGRVVECGGKIKRFKQGERVGIGWFFSSCGTCYYCQNKQENLCRQFRATGRDENGGYAEYMVVPAESAFPIPENFSDEEAAPLLCAGSIGFRSLNLTGIEDGQNLGLTGFGGSGHLVLKMTQYKFPHTKIFVFARSKKQQHFAGELGAFWAGDTLDKPPEKLDAVIDTTPAWKPVVEALKNIKPGGRLVINAIRKEDTDKDYLLNLSYQKHLWMEREIKSVANVTPRDIEEFLFLAGRAGIKPQFKTYKLEEANKALTDLKFRPFTGAKVLKI
jgi:propanol-preferring alcohol dehydrogenase